VAVAVAGSQVQEPTRELAEQQMSDREVLKELHAALLKSSH
jgi:hypothetical protein